MLLCLCLSYNVDSKTGTGSVISVTAPPFDFLKSKSTQMSLQPLLRLNQPHLKCATRYNGKDKGQLFNWKTVLYPVVNQICVGELRTAGPGETNWSTITTRGCIP